MFIRFLHGTDGRSTVLETSVEILQLLHVRYYKIKLEATYLQIPNMYEARLSAGVKNGFVTQFFKHHAKDGLHLTLKYVQRVRR